MQWNNVIQESILKEWTEGCQKAKNHQARLSLRRKIGRKYNLTIFMVQGIIELGATQGMNKTGSGEMQGGRNWEPINYHELIGDLEERIATLERKLNYLLDGVQKVLEDGETMAIHLRHLRQMGQWMKGKNVLDLDGRLRLK